MASLVDLNLRPDDRTLRQFGFIALGGFGLLGLCAWNDWLIFAFGLGSWRTGVAGFLAGLGVLAALFSLTWPKANLPIFVGLSVVAFPIGFVLSYVIMGTLFYGMITPVSLLFRIIGRDPMARAFEPGTQSYWIDSRPPRPSEHYFKQF